MASLPTTYSQPRQRPGQVDLERVGAPVVGNQSGADRYGNEEYEDLLLLEEFAERPGRRRQERRLRQVDREIKLHRADDERNPRENEQPDEPALAEHGTDAGRRNHRPRTPERNAASAVPAVALIVNGHTVSNTFSTHRLQPMKPQRTRSTDSSR